jgi:hypothetical protein
MSAAASPAACAWCDRLGAVLGMPLQPRLGALQPTFATGWLSRAPPLVLMRDTLGCGASPRSHTAHLSQQGRNFANSWDDSALQNPPYPQGVYLTLATSSQPWSLSALVSTRTAWTSRWALWAGGLSCTMSALKVCWSTYGMDSTTAIPPATMHHKSVGPMHPRVGPGRVVQPTPTMCFYGFADVLRR